MSTESNPTPPFEGVVIKKSTGRYTVLTNGELLPCAISNLIRKRLIYPTADPSSLRPVVQKVIELEHADPIAIGDRVRFIDAGDGTGLINEVLPRRNRLARRSAVPMPLAHGSHPFEQIIVANVDQVIPVFAAANPTPKWNLLDRYLVSAESLELPALVCITKLDLAMRNGSMDEEIETAAREYTSLGYPVILTSVMDGTGLAELRRILAGKVSVFVGKSGVGKTSLLNALQPGLGLRVNEVNQRTGKGKHTTTSLEMFPLESGGSIVDTPGIREFGLWDVASSDLALYFPEMRSLVGKCRFGLDCLHDSEPGCAIRKAVGEGIIHPRRYQSLMRLQADGYFQ